MATVLQIQQRKIIRNIEARRDVLTLRIAKDKQTLAELRVKLKEARRK